MIAALSTLIFLMVLALSGFVGWRMLAESGSRIAAAVEGIPAAVSPRRPRSAAV